mmetsp:Transcript_19018/g.42483  ORF Transcript_19018/g.42483 Transcript_19018/m.42483 type:complete len:99 (+) Transcript_19018:1833-2129(+)
MPRALMRSTSARTQARPTSGARSPKQRTTSPPPRRLRKAVVVQGCKAASLYDVKIERARLALRNIWPKLVHIWPERGAPARSCVGKPRVRPASRRERC